MPNGLVADTTLVANQFYLDIDGSPAVMLMSVSGLDVSVESVELVQTTKDGKAVRIRTMSSPQKTGQLTMTRLAVADAGGDGMWKWFKEIHDKGATTQTRKNGSVVLYSSDHKELARYNFRNSWISKISIDGLDISNGSPMKETITLEYDALERRMS